MLEVDGPSFSLAITLPACLIGLLVLLEQLRRLPDGPSAFVLIAIWMRYTIAMFHEVTYRPVIGSLSPMALATVGVVGLGFVMVGPRALRSGRLVWLYVFAAAALVSTVLSESWNGLFNNATKWLFLIFVATGAYEAMRRHGPARFFRAVAALFAAPIALQWLSFATDLKKISESSSSADLAVSYIAGYQHQAGFAVILLTFLLVVIFARPERYPVALGGVGLALAGLVLCDYRTAMIAAAPPVAAFVLTETVRRFRPGERGMIVASMAGLLVVGILTFAVLMQDRFADLFVIADKGSTLIKPPEHFTEPEQKMLSGRAILWSDYLFNYFRLSSAAMIVGEGPDSWIGRFPLYAHNNFVSFLYEYGLLGLSLYLVFLIDNIACACRGRGMSRVTLVGCHLSFVFLSLGTMPMWLVEGGIFYGLLLARTWHADRERALARRPAPTGLVPVPPALPASQIRRRIGHDLPA